MRESDKQLMREGRQSEALEDNYNFKPHSANIWINGVDDYRKRIDTNVISTAKYGFKPDMLNELNEILKEYPNAYHVVNDANCWL